MTYLQFHLVFTIPWVVLFGFLTVRAYRAGRPVAGSLGARSRFALLALAAHVGMAVVYTTPWDNYLVATRVWWYDPALVTGLTLGWVPIEE